MCQKNSYIVRDIKKVFEYGIRNVKVHQLHMFHSDFFFVVLTFAI